MAIPVPYWHSNCDSDEVLYYVEGDFMSRAGIEEGSFTLHPVGYAPRTAAGKTNLAWRDRDERVCGDGRYVRATSPDNLRSGNDRLLALLAGEIVATRLNTVTELE